MPRKIRGRDYKAETHDGSVPEHHSSVHDVTLYICRQCIGFLHSAKQEIYLYMGATVLAVRLEVLVVHLRLQMAILIHTVFLRSREAERYVSEASLRRNLTVANLFGLRITIAQCQDSDQIEHLLQGRPSSFCSRKNFL